MKSLILSFIIFSVTLISCGDGQKKTTENPGTNTSVEPKPVPVESPKPIRVGAERMDQYFKILNKKNIALVVNQTSMIGQTHLVDTLLGLDVSIQKIFAPEHGFRGQADAGEKIKDGKDPKTGLPLVSLYGKKKKPAASDLKGIDMIIFDIQDVGARFYTYISSMHYVMESCAENDVEFLVLDRPNPNGHFVDGPVLKKDFQSFVGMHEVPVVHGMTIGEYAKMINGEKWLKGEKQCRLQVIPCENYDHNTFYDLPVKPSPNLPNIRSIYLYPSLCFFEGTVVSAGRGTDMQFQIYGHPVYRGNSDFSFKPESKSGARYPKYEGITCYGEDLTQVPLKVIREEAKLNLSYLINFYNKFPDKETFFLSNNFFDKLAGTDQLKQQIIDEVSPEFIRETWEEDLNNFKYIRKKYLIYKDFY